MASMMGWHQAPLDFSPKQHGKYATKLQSRMNDPEQQNPSVVLFYSEETWLQVTARQGRTKHSFRAPCREPA